MKCNFVVGQQVVCICKDWSGGNATINGIPSIEKPPFFPEYKKIYTIIHLFPAIHPTRGELIVLLFPEWDLRPYYWVFADYNFRPLGKQETDISVFEKLLTPAQREADKQKVLVDG